MTYISANMALPTVKLAIYTLSTTSGAELLGRNGSKSFSPRKIPSHVRPEIGQAEVGQQINMKPTSYHYTV